MFNDMRAALGLQRAKLLTANTVPTVTGVLRLATIDGAKLLDMDKQIGSLTPGKKADLIPSVPGGAIGKSLEQQVGADRARPDR